MKARKHIVILGGGTAGWMTAACLTKLFSAEHYAFKLVESEKIGTVGVGEATIPHIRFFNQRLGIDEAEFMKAVDATFKLGIRFDGWGKKDSSYMHPFEMFGAPLDGVPFHDLLARYSHEAVVASLDQFSISARLAENQKFKIPADGEFGYAYHIDASLYASFLRKFSEERDLTRVEGEVKAFKRNDETGNIEKVRLDDDAELDVDLLIDCSGFSALGIGQTYHSEFEDWSQWLICDRAVAAPSMPEHERAPYTQSVANDYGWRWKIPLRNRDGNGVVFSSQFVEEETVVQDLSRYLGDKALAAPRLLTFKTGRRKKSWIKNCVGIGLSSGFLEPLESTSIYLIQAAVMKLAEVFPYFDKEPVVQIEFNRAMCMEYERVRDFLILHYHLNQRDDSKFWSYCREMSLPDSLNEKIELFRSSNYIAGHRNGLFLEPSWLAVYWGQGLRSDYNGARASSVDGRRLSLHMQGLISRNEGVAADSRKHHEVIDEVLGLGSTADFVWPESSMNLYGVLS